MYWVIECYFGGNVAGSKLVNELWSYDFSFNEWSQLEIAGIQPSPRYSHSSGLIGSYLYVYGGAGGSNDLWRFALNVEQNTSAAEESLMGITGAAIFNLVLVSFLGVIVCFSWRKLKTSSVIEPHGDIQAGSLDD